MKKEKVMFITLPRGAILLGASELKGGRVKIRYYEEKIRTLRAPSIPAPLVGGSSVYQKDGLPYWFCRIKDGRDEFMYLRMDDLSSDDLLYDATGKRRKFISDKQIEFKKNVLNALGDMPEEGFRWLPVCEPSVEEYWAMKFVPGEEVLTDQSIPDWQNMVFNYSLVNGSTIASKTTYFLLALRYLTDGIATLEELADDSSTIGNYRDFNNESFLEKAGERTLGGLSGIVGNTKKLVKDLDSPTGFSTVGGSYSTFGYTHPMADIRNVNKGCNIVWDATPLVELVR